MSPNLPHSQLRDLQRRVALYEDEHAFKALFFAFYVQLTRLASAITGSKESAEEIVGDVFASLWKNRASAGEIEDIQVYLYVAVKNNSIHYLKKHQKQQWQSLEDIQLEQDWHYQEPDRLELKELENKIRTAVASLPPRARLIFQLAKEDKLPYKHIADVLGISVKTVDNQLAIALKKLSALLGLTAIRKKKPS
jgi:RNA polymerase sigma-70 factor (ECF subfamily)